METLETYLKKLAAYEHTPPANLIAPWDLRDVDQIHVAFDDALNRTQISLSPKPNTTLSKLGNQIEKSFSDAFQKTVVGYNLLCCKGPGYPDRRLEDLVDARLFAFEIKAKTEFDLTNTARMVLTCGTRKLRTGFAPRPRPSKCAGPTAAWW
jgi:hypothetical protein